MVNFIFRSYMKIAGSDVSIERNNITTENAFTIKASGKAFRLLSDGLYSNKIQAVIRELSCNAYDAHIAANKLTEPFFVHLPTTLEPFFAVQDFGIGLSQEDVTQLYSTYFESTKNNSNDFVGAFGLGSKSPFSYVDSFTVISIFNGTKSTYAAFIGEQEVPSIALLGSELTAESNGITVQMSVKDRDITEFLSEAKKVYQYFDITPKFNIPDFKIVKNVHELFGDNWKYYSSSVDYSYGFRIIQGNVAYKLDQYFITDQMMSEVPILREVSRMIRNLRMDITVPIGTVEVAASREALSYNKQTINALKDILINVHASLKNQVIEYVEFLNVDDWKKLTRLKKFMSDNNDIARLFSEEVVVAKYKTGISVDLQTNPDFRYLIKLDGSRKINTVSNFEADTHRFFKILDNTHFFYNDTSRPLSWFKQYFKTLNLDFRDQTIIIIEPFIQYSKAMALLGNPEIKLTSELTKPHAAAKIIKSIQMVELTKNPNSVGGVSVSSLQSFTGELPEKGYYLETFSKKVWIDANRSIGMYEMLGYIRQSIEKNLFTFDNTESIYIFNKKQIKEIQDDSNWINIVDLIRSNLKDHVEKETELYNSLDIYNSHYSKLSYTQGRNIIEFSKLDLVEKIKNTVMYDYLTLYNTFKDVKFDRSFKDLAEKLYVTSVNIPLSNENPLNVLRQNIINRYPMMKSALEANSWSEKDYNNIVEYIQLIEKILTESKNDIKLVANNT